MSSIEKKEKNHAFSAGDIGGKGEESRRNFQSKDAEKSRPPKKRREKKGEPPVTSPIKKGKKREKNAIPVRATEKKGPNKIHKGGGEKAARALPVRSEGGPQAPDKGKKKPGPK